jgi:predicted ATPase with chaperone activity
VLISKLAEDLGVPKAEYIKSLILKDLRKSGPRLRRDRE